MRILYITTIGSTMDFFSELITELIHDGHIIDIATDECNGKAKINPLFRDLGCKVYPLSCSRYPLSLGNVKTIKEIEQIVEKGYYDIVHCHTPIAAACTRLACKGLRKSIGVKVYYTAHGFHFYKGASKKNWLIYYPVEWLCSWWTDVLITINQEDYRCAKDRFHAKKIEYIPGVGVDTGKFSPHEDENERIREEFEIADKFMLLSVGELNKNKNHERVIKAVHGLDLVYVIVGKGDLEEHLRNVADEVEANVIFTGFRTDVADFYVAADAFILPSLREGLNVSLMEAMASALPCLAGKIRGNIDLIDENGGYLFDPKSIDNIRSSIKSVMKKSKGMGEYNLRKIRKFDVTTVNNLVTEIYLGKQSEEFGN